MFHSLWGHTGISCFWVGGGGGWEHFWDTLGAQLGQLASGLYVFSLKEHCKRQGQQGVSEHHTLFGASYGRLAKVHKVCSTKGTSIPVVLSFITVEDCLVFGPAKVCI